jgi:pilus assembly protein CpaE
MTGQRAAIRVSVAVVEAHTPTRAHLVQVLGNGATPFSSVAELASRLTGAVPVVVVLGPSCDNPTDMATIERLIVGNPSLGVILVAEQLHTSTLHQAMRLGIRDVIALGNEGVELPDAVRRVALGLDYSVQRPPVAPPQRQGYEEPPIPNQYHGGQAGKVITVFSTKGGAGKSVIATSLAVTLAQRSPTPVCLVDADLQFGDVSVMLKLTPQHTIVDAVQAIDRMDAGYLEQLLMTHEPSGLRVLAAPLEPAFADQIGAAEMVAIVDMLRTFCSVVVVDTPAYFNDVVLGLVEQSDEILLVAGMDIPNIKNVKIGLQTLRLLGTPMDKVRLILNRANSKVKLDVGEVERTLQVSADSLVPSDIVVPQAVNKGIPVVSHAPRSSVAKAIVQLADLVAPVQEKSRR